MDFHLWRSWLSFVLILLEDSQFSDQPSSDVQHNLMIIVYSIRTHASESALNCVSPSLEGRERDTRYSTKTTITGCRKIRTHPSVLPNPLSFSAPRQTAHIVGRYITLTVIHRPNLCGMGPGPGIGVSTVPFLERALYQMPDSSRNTAALFERYLQNTLLTNETQMVHSFSYWIFFGMVSPKKKSSTQKLKIKQKTNTFCLEVLALIHYAKRLTVTMQSTSLTQSLKLKLFFSPRVCKPQQEELCEPSRDLWKIPGTQVLEEANMANIRKRTLKIFYPPTIRTKIGWTKNSPTDSPKTLLTTTLCIHSTASSHISLLRCQFLYRQVKGVCCGRYASMLMLARLMIANILPNEFIHLPIQKHRSEQEGC